jgi:transitional endoplasmic reticulum ATPase
MFISSNPTLCLHQCTIQQQQQQQRWYSHVLLKCESNNKHHKSIALSVQVIPDSRNDNDDVNLSSTVTELLSLKQVNEIIELKSNTNAKKVKLLLMDINNNSISSVSHLQTYLKQVKERTFYEKHESWFSNLIQLSLYNRIACLGAFFAIELLGEVIVLQVVEIDDQTNDINNSYLLNENTEYELIVDNETNKKSEEEKTLGGLSLQMNTIIQNLNIIFSEQGASYQLPKCYVVWGMEGTGKTTMKQQLLNHYKHIHTVQFTGSQIWSMVERGQISDLEQYLLQTDSTTRTLICIDDFELVAGKELMQNQIDNITVHQVFNILHELLDQVNNSQSNAVIVFTRNVDAIDTSFRVHGRLDREIYLPVPGIQQRQEILSIYMNKLSISSDELLPSIDKLNALTPGFVGRDIERLCRMALFHSTTSDSSTNIQWSDFEYALRVVKPSQISDLGVSIPQVLWEQFGGYEQVKSTCREIMYWPLEHPEAFERHGLPSCSGMLLYGPSGCGKTMLVKCLASLGRMNYISIKCPEIFSKYTGETEEIIRSIFQRARQLEPCVLVFDELDALAMDRSIEDNVDSGASTRALSQLLNEMDGIQSRKNVFLVGCTNRKDKIDPAVLRPGRLDQLIELPLPTLEDRIKIFHSIHKYNNMPMDESIVNHFKQYAEQLEGRTGADIRSICRESALEALRQDKNATVILQEHLQQAIHRCINRQISA